MISIEQAMKEWTEDFGPLPEGTTHFPEEYLGPNVTREARKLMPHKLEGGQCKFWDKEGRRWAWSVFEQSDLIPLPLVTSGRCFVVLCYYGDSAPHIVGGVFTILELAIEEANYLAATHSPHSTFTVTAINLSGLPLHSARGTLKDL